VATVYEAWTTPPDNTSVYNLRLPDYGADFLLLETGDNLLLETGERFLLESATVSYSATDALKEQFAWICPDSGVFANGDDPYKII